MFFFSHFSLKRTKALLQDRHTDKNEQNRYRETALLLALKERVDDKIINTLIDYDCDCNLDCSRNITPLHIATLDNRIEIMLRLLDKGAEIDVSTDLGLVPLHLAILTSNYEAFGRLLEYGADPEITSLLGFTPLMLAVSFTGIDPRICEWLMQFNTQKETMLGSALLCAIKGRHPLAERLIANEAMVNVFNSITGDTCLSESLVQGNKHIFDLIWPKFDKNLLETRRRSILEYFHETPGMKGADLVDCVKLILGTAQGQELLWVFYRRYQRTFIQSLFDYPDKYELTKQNYLDILASLSVVTYKDVSYIYQKFGFDKELVVLLKQYETVKDWLSEKTTAYVDFICFDEIETLPYNLKEILHLLKYLTPNTEFRTHFYNTFQCLVNSSDSKLEKLQLLYKLCDKTLSNRSVASLKEITRDKLRNIVFASATKPYKAIDELPVPDFFKEILFLKTPIYC